MNISMHTLSLPSEEIGEDRRQWVQLFPAGEFSGRDGRGPYLLKNAQAVIQETKARAGDALLPVDYEHQTDYAAKNGKPAPAAGWIIDLQERKDGLYALVEWTKKAVAHLSSKEYRYLSPTFYKDTQGEIKCLLRAGLTNNPNLHIKALAAAAGYEELDTEEDEEQEKGLLQRLRGLLGLPEDASGDAVFETVRILIEKNDTGKKGSEAETQEPSEVAVDGASKEVQASLARMSSEISSLRESVSTGAAERSVNDAIRAGKMTPGMRGWGIALAKSNPDAFAEFLQSTPPIFAHLFVRDTAEMPPNDQRGTRRLDEQQMAICQALGHKPEEYAATINQDTAKG